jgi:hypothetical protein
MGGLPKLGHSRNRKEEGLRSKDAAKAEPFLGQEIWETGNVR